MKICKTLKNLTPLIVCLTKPRITKRFRTLRVGVFFVSAPAAEFQFPALKNDLERPIKGGPCQLGQKSVGGKEKKENGG